jgi:hypothetical protein
MLDDIDTGVVDTRGSDAGDTKLIHLLIPNAVSFKDPVTIVSLRFSQFATLLNPFKLYANFHETLFKSGLKSVTKFFRKNKFRYGMLLMGEALDLIPGCCGFC